MSVIDASVWVSFVLPKDVHHKESHAWLSRQLLSSDVFIPAIALTEIAGAVARQTGDAGLAYANHQWLLQLPRLRIEVVDRELGDLAARIAMSLNLRGADAIYVALAQALDMPLVTWDEQQRERAGKTIKSTAPGM